MAELARVAAPTLVVVGEDEDPVHARAARSWLAAASAARPSAASPDAGHMLPLEQPGALAGAVCEFLRTLP